MDNYTTGMGRDINNLDNMFTPSRIIKKFSPF